MALLEKSAALYFSPESVGADEGTHCGICWKFNPKEKLCLEVRGSINGQIGTCGLYVHGEPWGDKINAVIRQVSKAEAGYVELGKTHCANCDEMLIPRLFGESRCAKVQGMVEGRGCCSAAWEPRK
jgi:hypothetical protein